MTIKNYNIGKKVKLLLLDMKKEEIRLGQEVKSYITVEETMILFQKKLLI